MTVGDGEGGKKNNVISVKQTNRGGMERMKEQMKKQMRSRQRHREEGFVVIALQTTGSLFWGVYCG